MSENDVNRLIRDYHRSEEEAREAVKLVSDSEETAHAGCLRGISDIYDYIPAWAAAEIILNDRRGRG